MIKGASQATGLSSPTELCSTVSALTGFDPSRVVHLRDNRAQPHSHTFGKARTWCGKSIVGGPEIINELGETYSSYGAILQVTSELDAGTCDHCRATFDAAYDAAFPD